MPLQDLTPQLRTRLNRMEQVTGLFILVAAFLLVFGFGYYIYHTAENRGWFADKARYYTFAKSAAGLQVGDHVKFLGSDVGEIIKIKEMSPDYMYQHPDHNIFVGFVILNKEKVNEHSGYIWTEGSVVRFNDVGGGFLGKRELELTKGTGGYGSYVEYPVREMTLAEAKAYENPDKLALAEEIYEGTNTDKASLLIKANVPLKPNLEKLEQLGRGQVWVLEKDKPANHLVAMWRSSLNRYIPYNGTNSFLIPPEEAIGLTDRLQDVAARIQAALPGILELTNKISATLANAAELTSNLNAVASEVRLSVTNLSVITGNLRNPDGSLGEWVLPAGIKASLNGTLQKTQGTIDTANGTLTRLDTNLDTLNLTLAHTADITGNLSLQVQANTNIVSNISQIIVHSDEFIQGLKRFWLFRSTFAPKKINHKPTGKPVAVPDKKPEN